MNKQYVEGVNIKLLDHLMLMDSKMVITMLALLFNDWERDGGICHTPH